MQETGGGSDKIKIKAPHMRGGKFWKGEHMKRLTRQEIREDLIQQLEDMKVTGKHFYDLVDDYMSMWDIKNSLVADIKERGVNVEYNNGGGQRGFKRNDSLSELTRVNAQMLKILQQLNITTAEVASDEIESLLD